MQHVKEQNWFAVGLDVIVVIVGIFLGLQVQQWYLDREFDENEQVLLVKLIDEIETNNRIAQYKINYRTQVIDSGERALKFLNNQEQCKSNCWSLLVDFFIASQATTMPIVSNIVEEMQRQGMPRNEKVKSSVNEYYVLSKSFSNATSINSNYPYRELVRQLMPSKSHSVLWETCLEVDAVGLEILIHDCPQGLSDQEIDIILERFKTTPLLKDYMNHWVGMQYPWRKYYLTEIEAGLKTITVIEQALIDPH